MSLVTFSELRTAAYCPRKCYYSRQRDHRETPSEVEEIRRLATRYDEVLESSIDGDSSEKSSTDGGSSEKGSIEAGSIGPIATDRDTYVRTLCKTRNRLEAIGRWEGLVTPADRNRLVAGKDCRGIVHKVLQDPLEPSILSTGRPPDRGVWEPQSVHAVAAAKALAWERSEPIERAWIEYPAYGIIRSVSLTTRRSARYRRAVRTVRELDGPPQRTVDRSKCESCTFADKCGVRTRTLRSLLGFG